MKEKSVKNATPVRSPFGKELTDQLAALFDSSGIPVRTIHHCGHCTNDPKTSLSAMLSARSGAKAVEFYKAFVGGELFRIENESGAVVAQLSVGESEFWVADESAPHPAKTAPYWGPRSPEHKNFSPNLGVLRRS
jgi:hypothetical protein